MTQKNNNVRASFSSNDDRFDDTLTKIIIELQSSIEQEDIERFQWVMNSLIATWGAGKYLVENMVYSAKLPPIGNFSLVMPILTEGGAEAHKRLIGLLHHIDE